MAFHQTDHARHSLPLPFDWWVRAIVEALMPSMSRRAPHLDVETLPDHLKRDLGLMDGRDPYREERR